LINKIPNDQILNMSMEGISETNDFNQ